PGDAMISFVVPAYNEEKYLGATLASIHEAARAAGEPYELIVADDASTDATAAIAQSAGARLLRVEKRHIAAVRNAGAKVAAGDMLIFVDADTVVNEAVVRAARAALTNGAVGGGATVMFGVAPGWVHAVMAMVRPIFRVMKWAPGCFVFCRREIFEKTDGFDERYFAGEEIHLSRALGRHGRFVVLRESVTTSARKSDDTSAWQMLWLMVKLVSRHPLGVKARKDAAFWYDVRR
ncbi:MAG TPA: glycosyltransferase, partial [Usitatibacter sp.]|nr:glycosyltransferase [Usitatibacter sp.]